MNLLRASGLVNLPRSTVLPAVPPVLGSGKRRIFEEAMASVRKDPLSIQFLGRWFWTLLPGHSPIEDSLPWMTFRAIRWLKSYLRPAMTVFEWGAGGSTIFLANRVRSVVSIESEPAWHACVLEALRVRGISNVALRLIPGPWDASLMSGADETTRVISQELHGQTFEGYANSINDHPDQTFDLVCVDGYDRSSCIRQALPKIRPGGYLLLDNSDWRIYRDALAFLSPFPRTDFGGVGPFQPNGWQTSVWRL